MLVNPLTELRLRTEVQYQYSTSSRGTVQFVGMPAYKPLYIHISSSSSVMCTCTCACILHHVHTVLCMHTCSDVYEYHIEQVTEVVPAEYTTQERSLQAEVTMRKCNKYLY